jgi:hypothetical protein
VWGGGRERERARERAREREDGRERERGRAAAKALAASEGGEEATPSNVSTPFYCKPRPESGPDFLTSAIIARQRTADSNNVVTLWRRAFLHTWVILAIHFITHESCFTNALLLPIRPNYEAILVAIILYIHPFPRSSVQEFTLRPPNDPPLTLRPLHNAKLEHLKTGQRLFLCGQDHNLAVYVLHVAHYGGISLTRNAPPIKSYSRDLPRDLW